MASSGKRKTTMAKLTRERRLMERRLDKQARKEARKHSAAQVSDSTPGQTDQTVEQDAPDAVSPPPPDA